MKIISLKKLKWISTALILFGILLTNVNYYPLNIFSHGLGAIGWSFVGYMSKDKALMTNFGLQLPLFMFGYYNYFY